MPLAAIVEEQLFCMHGGIPKKSMDKNMTELRTLKLPFESPRDNEIVADLLWSDPSEDVDGKNYYFFYLKIVFASTFDFFV